MMPLTAAVVACFAFIHLLEYLGYYARIAGHLARRRATGYAIQNAINTLTRFFYLLMMPVLGFIVDRGMELGSYLRMGLAALGAAACACLIVHGLRYRCIGWLLRFVAQGHDRELAMLELQSLRRSLRQSARDHDGRIWMPACIVFTCYAIGVLAAYFCALAIHDYRATISQLSGVVNGLATVLLTFVLEPRIARTIDRHDSTEAYLVIQALLRGRLLAIVVVAPALFLGVGHALA